MNLEDEDRRGLLAKEVLESPIYLEAYATIEEKLVNQLSLAETTAERGEHLRRLLVAHRKIRQYIEQVMVTGKMAEQELERQRSLADRILRRA